MFYFTENSIKNKQHCFYSHKNKKITKQTSNPLQQDYFFSIPPNKIKSFGGTNAQKDVLQTGMKTPKNETSRTNLTAWNKMFN